VNTSSIAAKVRATRAHVLVVALLAIVGLIASVPTAVSAHAATTTIVSLTFDDGVADQAQLPSLLPSGMPVTMYVNSGRVGSNGYLSWQQLSDLQAGGYEIGGHTVSHADLPTLSADEQKREVCDDRSALLSHGLNVADFAYPYGDDNAATQQIVHDCGYNSARTVGGLVSTTSCGPCPYANTTPPSNSYEIATPDSVKSDTTLDQLKALVTGVESHGGGWLPLVFHHLCSSNCPVYAVDPTVLHDFAAWLADRAGNGTTVATVGSVIGGSLQGPVAGPPPAPGPAGGNLLQNPSLEAGDPTPDCWQQGSTAVNNTAAFSHTSDAHTGSFGERIDITAYTSGDRKLVSKQDLGQCAPAVTPGHVYSVSSFYKTDTSTARLIAYYLDANNHWTYLTESKPFASAADWAQATWTVTAPSGAKEMSVGMLIASAGSLTVDDLSFIDTSDVTPPTVALTSPSDGYPVKGQQLISANASDASGISKVEFLIDGVVVGTATSSPYNYLWNSTTHQDGTVAIAARATDGAGNVATSPSINVMVSNAAPNTGDTTAPAVSLKSLPLAVTAATAKLAWTGTDAGSGLASYDVRYRRAAYNGTFGSWTAPSSWQATTASSAVLALTKGYDYCVQVRARDKAGNVSGWSATRCVTRALDDRALAKSSGWTRKTGKGYYLNTFTVTTRAKAALTRTGARVDRVGIIATKCKGCGTVGVYVGKKLIGKINLAAKTTRKQQLILLPRFAYRTGMISIKVLTGGKTVQIDGLIACRT